MSAMAGRPRATEVVTAWRRRWRRRRRGSLRRGAVWLLLGALACSAVGAVAAGDADAQQARRRSPPAARTEAERRALELLEEDKLISARRVADEILAAHARSMVGHYVKGCVLHQAEGALGRAIYHLGRARELYETTWAAHPRPPDAPWEFHRQLLFSIQVVAGELEEYEYQLEILEYHDALYQPDLTAERAWPLLHLGRVKEARRWAKAAAESADHQQRSLGLNTLCAIEGEAGERQAYAAACRAAYEHAEQQERSAARRRAGEVDVDHRSTLAVHAFNAAVAARAAFEFADAEQLAREGARRLAFTPANPWRFLVRHHVAEARMKDAIEALREMQRWRRQQPPNVRDQVRAETDVTFATVLLLAGRTETALRSVDLAIERPDRRGMVSSTAEQATGAHALLRRALLQIRAEQLAEQASWTGRAAQVTALADRLAARLAAQADEERIIGVLTDEERLVATFRPYVRGGIEPVPSWLLGDLVEVLGAGVAAVAVRRVRAEDEHPGVGAYCDALEAEIALADGDDGRAAQLGRRALETLPKREALLRARVAAVASEAAREAGRTRLSASLLEQAMTLDPGVVRRLGLSIPARITVGSSSNTAQRAAELLARSPRLRSEPGAFEITIDVGQGVMRACLRGPTGSRLACAEPPAEAARRDGVTQERPSGPSGQGSGARRPTVGERARGLVEAFHRQVLAMPLGLSGTDLSSLDGSTTVAEQAVREQLSGVLDELVEQERAPQ